MANSAMTDGLRFPPVDVYRQPFIEPLGYLVIASAQLEAAAIRFFGLATMLPAERREAFDWSHADTAWDLKNEEKVRERIGAIDDEEIREGAARLWAARCLIQTKRNRLIHDVIDLGLFISDEGRTVVQPLLGPNMQDRQFDPATGFRHISPAEVADLATAAHTVAKDFDFYASLLPTDPWPGEGHEQWVTSDD